MILLKNIAPVALLLSSAFAASAEKPTLHIDCSFTGAAGELCKSASEAWAKERGVNISIERKIIDSTEKLAKYTRLLESKSHDLDIFGVDVIWPGVLHKHLLDLEPYFTKSRTQYLAAYIENNTVNGRLLAVPFSLSMGLMFYRTDLLQRYGLKPPETWTELEKAAIKIQEGERAKGNAKFWGYVFQGKAYEGLTCNALEWIASRNGGMILDASGKVKINTDPVFQALNMAAGWIGKISPTDVLQFAEADTYKFFKEGHAAFLRAWPSAWTVVNDPSVASAGKVGVMLIPKGDRGKHTSTLGGYSLAVAGHTKHPALAADLVKYLSSTKEQKRRSIEGGSPPTITSLFKDDEVLKSAPYHAILLPVLENAALRPSRITRGSYPEVSKEFWTAVHSVLEGKESALKAMSALQTKLDAMSKRWKR